MIKHLHCALIVACAPAVRALPGFDVSAGNGVLAPHCCF